MQSKISNQLDFLRKNRVAVVIATHRKYPNLYRFINSFQSLIANPLDLIFVDNGSEEFLLKWVKENFPNITAIRLPENHLFCGGYNAGIRLAMKRGYEFILMSNADTEVVNSNFLAELLEAADRQPRAAFLGPLVFWRSEAIIQKTDLEFPRLWRNLIWWVPYRLGRNGLARIPRREAEVEFVNNVCVLCRVKALGVIGLLDENMGGYWEDADWAWRAKEKGWLSVYVPVPSVIHHENLIGYEPYSLKTFLEKRNTVYWYLKFRMRGSAQCYALASMFLAKNRLLLAKNSEERRKHSYFFRRLRRAFRGLLCREPLGEWFGPPFGSWVNDHDL